MYAGTRAQGAAERVSRPWDTPCLGTSAPLSPQVRGSGRRSGGGTIDRRSAAPPVHPQDGSARYLPLWYAGRPVRESGSHPRVLRDNGKTYGRGLYPQRPRALGADDGAGAGSERRTAGHGGAECLWLRPVYGRPGISLRRGTPGGCRRSDRKSTRLNSSHTVISYAVFCLKKKKKLECYLVFGSR